MHKLYFCTYFAILSAIFSHAGKMRRKTKNNTGITRISKSTGHDAWIGYVCVNCGHTNHEHIGAVLLKPKDASKICKWTCENCSFVHSGSSDLPEFENWEGQFTKHGALTVERFWDGFFSVYTEKPESYWKQCNTCGKILPFTAFSKHVGWGPLERQMECRGCKAAINAVLNPLRTKEQLHEGSKNRRIGDLLLDGEDEAINIEDLFERFEGKCFKTGVPLNIEDRQSWHIDHILPSRYLYPLTKTNAALLSREANSNKRDRWPSEFYTNNQLLDLARITGARLDLLSSKTPIVNQSIDVNKCVERFLRVREHSDLQKRIIELIDLLKKNNLVEKLNDENKDLLGI